MKIYHSVYKTKFRKSKCGIYGNLSPTFDEKTVVVVTNNFDIEFNDCKFSIVYDKYRKALRISSLSTGIKVIPQSGNVICVRDDN